MLADSGGTGSMTLVDTPIHFRFLLDMDTEEGGGGGGGSGGSDGKQASSYK